MAESYPRSSLMESFVPFGGFFSAPSDLKLPLAGLCGICMVADAAGVEHHRWAEEKKTGDDGDCLAIIVTRCC
ncbi:hypothetical protein ACFX1W_000693 [Malus domestica]